MFGRSNRILDNYTNNFGKYSCEAPTEVFKNCCGECRVCKFARLKENSYKFYRQGIDEDIAKQIEAQHKLVDFVLSLPYSVARQYLKALETKLKERNNDKRTISRN